MPSASRNGLWLKVLGALIAAAVIAAGSVAWSLNGRVMRNETRADAVERRLATIEFDIKELLRRVPPR